MYNGTIAIHVPEKGMSRKFSVYIAHPSEPSMFLTVRSENGKMFVEVVDDRPYIIYTIAQRVMLFLLAVDIAGWLRNKSPTIEIKNEQLAELFSVAIA